MDSGRKKDNDKEMGLIYNDVEQAPQDRRLLTGLDQGFTGGYG